MIQSFSMLQQRWAKIAMHIYGVMMREIADRMWLSKSYIAYILCWPKKDINSIN